MRKLIVAAVACVAVGVSGAAFARGGGGGRGDGGSRAGAGGGGSVLIPPGVRGDRGTTAAPTSGRSNVTLGTSGGAQSVTIDGQTFVGTGQQGQSGASGSPDPIIAGRPALFLLGLDKGTTSKREACPGWMQTSGLDYCIRPQDQLRPADVRR